MSLFFSLSFSASIPQVLDGRFSQYRRAASGIPLSTSRRCYCSSRRRYWLEMLLPQPILRLLASCLLDYCTIGTELGASASCFASFMDGCVCERERDTARLVPRLLIHTHIERQAPSMLITRHPGQPHTPHPSSTSRSQIPPSPVHILVEYP